MGKLFEKHYAINKEKNPREYLFEGGYFFHPRTLETNIPFFKQYFYYITLYGISREKKEISETMSVRKYIGIQKAIERFSCGL